MPVHQVLNITPFEAAIAPCQDREGRDLAVAVLKATYKFTAQGEVSPHDEQLPVFMADVPNGDPATASLRYASDISPAKPGTDVAVVGSAHGRGRKEISAGFRLGPVHKALIVSGPRVWALRSPPTIAGPVAFDAQPIDYEHAFGGSFEAGGKKVVFDQNPAGVGFCEQIVERAPLPSVEFPDARYQSPKDRPRPAGLGFIPPGWKPRVAFGGTYDAAWEKNRRPLMPADLDERFWNTVPQDQVLRPKLAGGERLVLLGLHPEAEAVTLTIPRFGFSAAFRVKGGETLLPMTADTLLVEPDQGRIAITFRAILPVGDDLMRLASVVFRDKMRDSAAGPAARPA